jgi:hypothetical protein
MEGKLTWKACWKIRKWKCELVIDWKRMTKTRVGNVDSWDFQVKSSFPNQLFARNSNLSYFSFESNSERVQELQAQLAEAKN